MLVFHASIEQLFSLEYVILAKEDKTKRIRGNKIFRLHMVAKWAADLVRHPRLIATISQVKSNWLIGA